MPLLSRPYDFVSPCTHLVHVVECSGRRQIQPIWSWCCTNKIVGVISYITIASMQEACRTSIRNSTGNSESMILTSGPPHGWPGSAPPHGWVSGYCPDWQERAGWHRRRCGECSKNISDLYGIHYKKTLALPGSSTLEFLILPIPAMGGQTPDMDFATFRGGLPPGSMMYQKDFNYYV